MKFSIIPTKNPGEQLYFISLATCQKGGGMQR